MIRRAAAVAAVKPEAPIVVAFRAWQARPNARTMGLFLEAARPVLLRHLSRHLRDHPDAAEDLAQNCLLRMAEAGALFTFRGTGDLQSWIAVVARNAAVSFLRAPARLELPTDSDEHRREERSREPSPEEDAIRAVDRATIERAIERAANRERDDYPGIDPATASTADCIRAEIEEIREVLLEKNAAYGDSALSPIRIMSRADPVEQLRVRIDDKLSRLARGSAAGEDVILDLLGYLVLLRIAMRRAKP